MLNYWFKPKFNIVDVIIVTITAILLKSAIASDHTGWGVLLAICFFITSAGISSYFMFRCKDE